jgi:hypothetical protein
MEHLLRPAEIGHVYQLKRVLTVSSAELASLFIPQNLYKIRRIRTIALLYNCKRGMRYGASERAAKQYQS